MNDIIHKRFSPSSFTQQSISTKDIEKLFDAARNSASSYNEQPWRFVYAQKKNKLAFEKILSCLVPGNQEWAKNADLLILTFCKKYFTKNNKPNNKAEHDLGLAVGNLTTQASLLGIYVHNMGGINTEKIKELFEIPNKFRIMTAIAVGYTKEKKHDIPKKKITEIALEEQFDFRD